MSKKKIIAILLFIFIGLFMFTFANPGESVEENDKSNVEDSLDTEKVDQEETEAVINSDDDISYDINENNYNNTTSEQDPSLNLDPDGDEDKDGYTNEEEKENGSDPLDPESTPEDNTPKITVNPTTVKIVEGTNYDVMTGVSVEDDFDKLTAEANITDTTKLEVGKHEVTYTAKDRAENEATETREIEVLSKNGDEDKDGYTNGEEKENGSDPLDPESTPTDEEAPVITVNPTTVKIVEGTSYDVMTGVSAKDNLDGDITENIELTNPLDIEKPGNYTVTYTVEDRAGNVSTATREIEVLSKDGDEDKDGYTNGEEKENGSDPLDPESTPTDEEAPEITINGQTPVVVIQGEEYEDEGATAKDNLDGDITDKIETANPVDTTKVADYEVTYTVEDRAGNEATETREVKVVAADGDEDKDGYTNEEEKENGSDPLDPESTPTDEEAPVITVNPTTVKIVEGTSYDVMTGVSAKDNLDGDITENIELTNPLDIEEPGNYTVTYTVTDRAGNVATATRTITVTEVDKEAPVIVANAENANGAAQAIVNINVTDNLSGVAEVHYLPKAYNSVDEYMADVNSSTQPVTPINLTLDENGNTTITSYFNSTYTIYAIDNVGNASIKTVTTSGIEAGEDDIVDDGSAVAESIKGVTINVSSVSTDNYGFGFLRVNPERNIEIVVHDGYEVESVKWESGRQDLSYFQSGRGNEEYLEFTLGGSFNTNVYTLYVKTKETETGEVNEGVIYIYNNAYWLWFLRF